MRIVIVDDGIGNLRSVQKAFQALGAMVDIVDQPENVLAGDGVVLPGVAAFGDGMDNLRVRRLDGAVREVVRRGTPFLGICDGLQLLFDESEEMGRHSGLGILPGRVVRFPAGLTVPHMGWNQIDIQRQSRVLEGVRDGSFAYFAHSYHAQPDSPSIVVATSEHGSPFPSVLARDNVWAIQFHPEKSQAIGLTILRNFVDYVHDRISGN